MSDLDRDPGFYKGDGGSAALVDQQRAETRDKLRGAKALSVTYHDEDDGVLTHWAVYLREDDGAPEFLFYVLARAWRDVLAATGRDHEWVYSVLREALDRGIGK